MLATSDREDNARRHAQHHPSSMAQDSESDDEEVEVMAYDSDGSLMPERDLEAARLDEAHAWIRQVEEENNRLREQLQLKGGGRSQQNEPFRKNDSVTAREDYLDPSNHLAGFGNLPAGGGASMARRRKGKGDEGDEEQGHPTTAPNESNRWTEASLRNNQQAAGNQIAALGADYSPSNERSVHRQRTGTGKEASGSGSGSGSSSSSCWRLLMRGPVRFLVFLVYTIGVVLLSVWVFHRTQGKDKNSIPWKWLEFLE